MNQGPYRNPLRFVIPRPSYVGGHNQRGLSLIELVEMSYNLQSRTEYGVSDRAQIHPRAALAPARPDHAHDPKPRTRPAPCRAPSFGKG